MNPVETIQKPIVAGLQLGEGFNETLLPLPSGESAGTGQQCVGNVVLPREPKPSTRLSSFYSSRVASASATAKAAVSGDIPLEVIDLGVEQAFELTYDYQTTGEMLFLVADITTATQRLATDSSGEPIANPDFPEFCEEYQFSNYGGFLSSCGTKFLTRQDYGGVIVVGINTEEWSSNVSGNISHSSSVGIANAEIGLDAMLSVVMSEAGQEQSVFVNVLGFDVPAELFSSSGDTSGMVDIAALHDWVASLDESDGQWVREQEFKRYRSHDFGACGLSPDLATALSCGTDFFGHRSAFLDHDGMRLAAEALDERLQNPDMFRWFAPSNPDTTQVVIDRYAQCGQDLWATAEACEMAMTEGDLENLCDACAMPDDCESQDVFAALQNELDHVQELPEEEPPCQSVTCQEPIDHARPQNQGAVTAPRDDVLCTFSGLRGLMAGGAEGAWVEPFVDPTGNRKWSMDVISERVDQDEKLTGYFHCTPKGNFWNAASDTMNTEASVTLTAGDEIPPPWSSNDYVSAVSGIRGEMEGGGENALYDWEHDQLEVHSGQGFLEGWFTGFGMNTQTGGAPLLASYGSFDTFSVSTSDVGDRSVKLPHSHVAHCYLTRIAGKFDGGGESVRLSIDPITQHWELRARAACEDGMEWDGCDAFKSVNASARCLLYDQRGE